MKKTNRKISAPLLQASILALACGLFTTGALPLPGGLSAPVQAEAAPMKRFLNMAPGKSMVLRLPRAASDILLGDPKVVEAVIRSRRMVYIFAKKMGQTDIHFLDRNGNPILTLDINVRADVVKIQELIKKFLPKANIKVEFIGGKVFLSGVARNASEVKKAVEIASMFAKDSGTTIIDGGDYQSQYSSKSGKNGYESNYNSSKSPTSVEKKKDIINNIVIAGKDQVMLKVKIAEVQRDVAKQFGINTELAIKKISTAALTGGATMAFPFSLGNSLGTGEFKLNYNGSNVTTNTILRAMERDGIMRLLAEPTLTAVSGEAATFLAGGEVPVVSAYDSDSHTYTYEMKPFGVALGFTPLVLSEGRISLKIKTEVSEISNKYSMPVGNLAVPGFEKRATKTTVELPSGGTLAIGGLIKESTKQNIDGLPALKNLPILGALFRSRDYMSNRTELVIMVTPYIVNPVNEKQLRTPVDRLNIASDEQTIFLGRLHRVYGAPGGPKGEGRVYHGNVGFIVE